MNDAKSRCRNVHPTTQLIQIFLRGLDPVIKSAVGLHWETNRKETYLELAHFARSEGDTYRTRFRRHVSFDTPRGQSPPTSHTSSPLRSKVRTGRSDRLNLLGKRPGVISSPPYSSSVPSYSLDTDISQADPVNFLTQQDKFVRPPRIPSAEGSNIKNRPGWVDRGPSPVRSQPLICHACYALNHIAPHCILPVRNLSHIVSNYEALDERARDLVPDTAYRQVRALMSSFDGTSDTPESYSGGSKSVAEVPAAQPSDQKLHQEQ